MEILTVGTGALVVENTRIYVDVGFSTTSGSNKIPWNGSWSDIQWTDISQYVRSIETRRGRSKELDAFTAGSASIVLDNRSRIFDPDYAAGPYYGSLTPMRPIRIRATYLSGSDATPLYDAPIAYDTEAAYDEFPIFAGFVDGWPQSYEHPNNATVSISCSDAFKLLNLYELDEYWSNQILRSSPMLWYRMDDGTGSAYLYDTMVDYVPDVRERTGFSSPQTVTDGRWWKVAAPPAYRTETEADSLITNSANKSALFDGDIRVLWTASSPITLDDTNFAVDPGTVECVFSYDYAVGLNNNYGLICFGDGSKGTLKFAYVTRSSTFGIAVLRVGLGYGPYSYIPSAPYVQIYEKILGLDYTPLSATHLVMTSGNNWGAWINGIKFAGSEFTPVAGYTPVGSTYNGQIGTAFTTGSGTYLPADAWIGKIDEVVLHRNENALSPAQIQLRSEAMVAGGYTDTASTRLERVLDQIGWPADAQNISPTTDVVFPYAPSGTALAYAQTMEQAEQGRLFVDAVGDVRFVSRSDLVTEPNYVNAQTTFGDGVGEYGYVEYQHQFDDQLIRNKITITRADGYVVPTVSDQDSIESYWERPESISGFLILNTGKIAELATYRLNTYAHPQPRINAIQITPMGHQHPPVAGYWPPVLRFDIGTRVKVRRRPQDLGSMIEYQTTIEGISHSITPRSWFTTYELSPASTTDQLILDNADIATLDSPTAKLGY